ncbi:Ig-like domain-containing protein, partial [Xenorhabdus entomophaga]|uniref:Ig-like domain-containing protein n=1 Tax=Xenorhabdus entomophaga TaxID=3136257 RepID=UPI0030F45C05
NQQQATLTLVLRDRQDKPVANIQPRLHFAGSGALSGTGDEPKMGAIQEDPANHGTYIATVTAGTKTGEWTVTPAVDGRAFPKLAAKITFNPPTPPSIKDLKLKVANQKMLVVGETLQAEYVYEHNGGNKTDNSFYAWGEEGQTVAAVEDLAKSGDNKSNSSLPSNTGGGFSGIVQNGKPQDYLIVEGHAGKVLEFSILARNGVNARAKDILTLTTNDTQNKGNETKSKIDGGRVANVADTVEVKLDAQGKDTVVVNGKSVVKLRARENETPNSKTDSIQLTIKTQKHGKSAAWVPVVIKMSGVNRQNVAVQPPEFKTKLDGKEGEFIGYTDQTGQFIKIASDPEGIGVRTTLKAIADGITGPVEEKTDVIFTVITSPDTDKANYWGHMVESILHKGVNYRRPLLHAEWPGSSTYGVKGSKEVWAGAGIEKGRQYCNNLPTLYELFRLATLQLYNEYGWSTNDSNSSYTVWSGSAASEPNRWWAVNLVANAEDWFATSSALPVICKG